MAKSHEYFMQMCLDLAQKGLGNVSPNPLVGAVIVRNDEVVGQGFHQQYGQAHAEVNAVASLHPEEELHDATIYVNLEPCSHYGKTPPCSELIIKTGIPHVVIGMQDPNPQVAGNGIKMLREAGVNVEGPVLEEQCLALNRRFIVNQIEKRPYIILKWAQSQDGFMDPPREKGEKGIKWITAPETRKLTHAWRTEEDAILAGRNTVEIDNPQLTARDATGHNPVRIVIDPGQVLNQTEFRVFDSAARTIVLAKSGQSGSDVSVLPDSPDWLTLQMQYLLSENIGSVIVEGGKHTLQQFIDVGLWDEARILTGAVITEGGAEAPAIEGELVEEFMEGPDRIQVYSKP